MKHLLGPCVLVFLLPAPCPADPPADEIELLRSENARLRAENRKLKEELARLRGAATTEPGKNALPIPREKWYFGQLKADCSAEVKALTFDGKDEVTLTCQFTDSSPALAAVSGPSFRMGKTGLSFWFIDRDNVTIHKVDEVKFEGEFTAVKGDAFRLRLKLPPKEILDRAVHVEVRRKK